MVFSGHVSTRICKKNLYIFSRYLTFKSPAWGSMSRICLEWGTNYILFIALFLRKGEGKVRKEECYAVLGQRDVLDLILLIGPFRFWVMIGPAHRRCARLLHTTFQCLYRVRVVSAFLKAGVPLPKLYRFHDILEEHA